MSEISTTAQQQLNDKLMVAAYGGCIDMALGFIASGAQVNAQNEDGISPLKFAVVRHYVGMTQALIAKGANVNAPDNEGNTPLILAVKSNHPNHLDMLKALLVVGADINATNKKGESALTLAAKNGDFDSVKMFHDCGFDISPAHHIILEHAAKKQDAIQAFESQKITQVAETRKITAADSKIESAKSEVTVLRDQFNASSLGYLFQQVEKYKTATLVATGPALSL